MPPSLEPLVSVVMPVHNGAAFLAEALGSVLGQSFVDFELVVVDDGSDDDGPDLVESVQDDRVRLIRLAENVGIAQALNRGVREARAPLIARMDADDVSHRERLAAQVAFLDSHPDVGIVGCQPQLIDATGAQVGLFTVLTRDVELRRMLRLQGPFCHGSVMFRREVLVRAGGYVSTEQPAEDYALWVRMAGLTLMANLGEPLYSLRVGGDSVSTRSARHQLERKREIQALAREGRDPRPVRLGELRAGRRYYTSMPSSDGQRLAERYVSQHRELAVLDVVEDGWVALPTVLRAVALDPMRLRPLMRMVRFYRSERAERHTIDRI